MSIKLRADESSEAETATRSSKMPINYDRIAKSTCLLIPQGITSLGTLEGIAGLKQQQQQMTLLNEVCGVNKAVSHKR